MENFEMETLQETGRVVEKKADFAGNVIVQLLQKQGYVEKQGIKALLDHIREGGGTLTTVVSEERAEDFKELMKKEHIPYVEIEHTDSSTKEKSLFFVYRDCDRMGVKEVLKQFEIALGQTCHEVDLETFIAMRNQKSYGTVGNLTKAEVYAFRETAKGYVFEYCVVADDTEWEVYFDMALTMLEEIVNNNKQGKSTVMIVPVGPTQQYPILAEMVNRFGVSLKNVHFFKMDEYMISETEVIDSSDPAAVGK